VHASAQDPATVTDRSAPIRRVARRHHVSSAHLLARRWPATGAFLLEALVAIVVFAVGTLGLLELIAGAARESGNARWRDEAFTLAASTLSRMWTEDPATLDARYNATSGAGYRALRAAAERLPGVSGGVQAPLVPVDTSIPGRWRVANTVFWQQPGERRAHRARAAGMLPRN
jgi:type IV pilus assembly protein PilV